MKAINLKKYSQKLPKNRQKNKKSKKCRKICKKVLTLFEHFVILLMHLAKKADKA